MVISETALRYGVGTAISGQIGQQGLEKDCKEI